MLIEIHAIQNHSPANLNRDDLGAPKTCYFGGVLRSRISSQCLKRSIRMSDEFKLLCGGVRTRRLPKLLAENFQGKEKDDFFGLAQQVVQKCGVLAGDDGQEKDVIVFLSKSALPRMVQYLRDLSGKSGEEQVKGVARKFAQLIARERHMPDMALSGRMLEPSKTAKEVWKDLDPQIEAALQVGHAISTHEARPEVDYFVAADDVKGEDVGGAHIGEAMYSSACYYKYFSVHWETLVTNLAGFSGNKEHLAAHTLGAFVRGAALTNPTGKQNSFAAHNPPDGILVEIRNTPISYANAFAKPVVAEGEGDIISQSIAQLAQYVHDIENGYGKPVKRLWFSPNLRFPLVAREKVKEEQKEAIREVELAANNLKSLDGLVRSVVEEIGYDWEEVQKVAVNAEVA
jgi:CRISPR system Cascade subunit CasC